MKFVYPAVFYQNSEGRYIGYFPDLEDCHVSADSLDECLDNAREAAENWILLELSEDDPLLPGVSDPADLTLPYNGIIRNIAVTVRFHTGWDE